MAQNKILRGKGGRKKESRASMRAELNQKKEKNSKKSLKEKREEFLLAKQARALRGPQKIRKTTKKRKDAISPGYTQLLLDIELLKKALKTPVKSSSLAIGKKRTLMLKHEERKKRREMFCDG